MASKDNLEFILKELCRHLDKSQQDDIIKKAIPIVKDLDVLEILKKHLINSDIGKFDNVEDNEILHLKLTLSGKEYNTIKEWLENGINWLY